MQIKINRKQISSINIRQRIQNKNTLNGRKNVILRSKIWFDEDEQTRNYKPKVLYDI